MKINQIIAALAFIATSQQAFAGDVAQQPPQQLQRQVTQEQVATALAILLEAGIIELVDGEIKVKNRSALDQLNEQGRLKVEAAAMHSICF